MKLETILLMSMIISPVKPYLTKNKAILEAFATYINQPEYQSKDFTGRMKILSLYKEKKP